MHSLIQTLSLLRARSMKAWIASILLGMLLFTQAEADAQTVLSVREAEFRSRWEGRQEDRAVPAQYFQPDGGLGEDVGEQVGEPEASEEPQPQGFSQSMDSMAESLKRRLRFGPLDFQLGMGTGWEYTNQNSVGGDTDFNDNNSFFAAPTAAVTYEREVGVWNVSAQYSAGYRYYFNQDYTAAGTGA